MIIDCISDLHGHFPKLEGGDLLVVAGDLTSTDSFNELSIFYQWLDKQSYKKKVVVSGNHDNYFYACHAFINPSIVPFGLKNTEYLCDSGTEFEGLKIWGSPWTKTFPGMNPKCKAFTVDTEEELTEKWSLIPEDIDILVTHCPPCGVFDMVDFSEGDSSAFHTGSKSLLDKVHSLKNLKALVFGHIHEWGGRSMHNFKRIMVNASHVNERYEPVNKPVRIDL